MRVFITLLYVHFYENIKKEGNKMLWWNMGYSIMRYAAPILLQLLVGRI